MLFYLVGPIQYVDDYTEWRMEMKYFLENIGHKVLLPWSLRRHNHFQVECKVLLENGKMEEARQRIIKKNGLLLSDIKNVIKADCLLVYLPKDAKIYGTAGEITLGFYLKQFCGKKKTILTVTDFEPSNLPLWILGCSDVIFKSFEDCKRYIQKAL